MGTPEFAVPALKILIENGYKPVAAVTAPDKPKGRGQKLGASPLKEAALQHNIPVLQPANLKNPDFLEALKGYQANLQIVVAFRMLPEAVWNMPEIGTFNLHASLLPQYRGAAPINWAIINGEKETGVTTFFLKHKIDTGNIIFQEKEPITEDDTMGDLYTRLMKKGANLVLKTVQAIEKENYPQTPQVENGPIKEAPKIFKETCRVDWKKSTEEVYNFIRGLSPYPAAWTVLNNKPYKIYRSNKDGMNGNPGNYQTDQKTYLRIFTKDGSLLIRELQPQGKRKMTVEEFFRGNKI